MTISDSIERRGNGDQTSNGYEKNVDIDLTREEPADSEKRSLSMWQRFKKKWFRMKMLLGWTILGVLCGIAIGGGLYHLNLSSTAIKLIGYPGELMIRALQELILPLMVSCLMSGVFALRGTKIGSGRVARWALSYYLLSMIIAIFIGIGTVFTIRPGRNEPFNNKNKSAKCSERNNGDVKAANSTATSSAVDSLLDLGRDLIPNNIVAAAALPNYLGVMVFAVVFALFLVKVGEKAEPLIQAVEVLTSVVIKIIYLVIVTTPVGIASWIATTILKACSLTELVKSLGLFVVTILTGFSIHFFIALPLTLLILSQRNPFKAFKSWLPAFALALGTSSSAATMPVSMECGKEHGCNHAIVNFVLPLGTNVNRDGTALYEAVAVIFICQAHGLSLSVGQVVVIVIVATLAAVGTASIPHAGLVTLITALQATGNAQFVGDLSLLYAVDWILGMFRTVVNVWGDACATVVVDAWLNKYGKDIEMKSPEDDAASKLEDGAESREPLGLRRVE